MDKKGNVMDEKSNVCMVKIKSNVNYHKRRLKKWKKAFGKEKENAVKTEQ